MAETDNPQDGPAPFKGFAHPMGVGLTLSVRGRKWTLTLETSDGSAYPPFQGYHQREMTAADVKRFVRGTGQDWHQQTGATGRTELVAVDSGFRVRLAPTLGAQLDRDTMVSELESLLAEQ